MIVLYHSGGAGDFSIVESAGTPDADRDSMHNAIRVLRRRNLVGAANLLSETSFQFRNAFNHFNDDFSILYAELPLDQYEALRVGKCEPASKLAWRQIADVLSELGMPIRFIAVEIKHEKANPTQGQRVSELKKSEITVLVNRYIGVEGGYLADLSYRSHAEFYAELDLEIDPNQYSGTTRERFIKILSESGPETQARILEGVLEKYPAGSSPQRTQERHEKIRAWIARLRGGVGVSQPKLRVTSTVVERALKDAEELLRSSGATSGVDRIHTVLHGYLLEVCKQAGIPASSDPSISELFKELREHHPALKDLGPRPDDITKILRSLSAVLDALNPLRNRASVAHPNDNLLPEAEAMLVINGTRTILHYLNEKLHVSDPNSGTGS